jgi:integrase
LRQVLDAAVAWEFVARNPAKATGKNPAPPVIERVVLEPADVDRLAAELRSPYDVAVIVGARCYLRPSELLAIERGDVGEGVLRVNGTKTRRSVRTVPVPLRARQALDELPPRLDTRLLFQRHREASTALPTGVDGSSSGPARRRALTSR